jgi:O-antigen ligase
VQNNYFESALWRISLLFNSDFHVASSGRDVLYNNALAQIKEHPILGSGIGSYAEKAGEYIYPHNIILEILLDFGFIGLIFFVPIIIYLFLRTVKILNQNDISYNILGFFFLNSFIKLMFSGSYLADLQFCISIILITTTKILNERKQEIVTLNTEIKI